MNWWFSNEKNIFLMKWQENNQKIKNKKKEFIWWNERDLFKWFSSSILETSKYESVLYKQKNGLKCVIYTFYVTSNSFFGFYVTRHFLGLFYVTSNMTRINKSLIIKYITSNKDEMNLINFEMKEKKISENKEKNTMIFKMKENGRYIEIDEITKEVKKTECMKIYKADEPFLFSIGDEMTVKKKGMQSYLETESEMNNFYPARIIFIQLKDKNKHPNRKQLCISSLTTELFAGRLDDKYFNPMRYILKYWNRHNIISRYSSFQTNDSLRLN